MDLPDDVKKLIGDDPMEAGLKAAKERSYADGYRAGHREGVDMTLRLLLGYDVDNPDACAPQEFVTAEVREWAEGALSYGG